jgi:hypothetical protein
MDPVRFDLISKRLARRRLSRRLSLRGLVAAGGAVALFGLRREHAAADCPDLVYCRRWTEFSPGPNLGPIPGGPYGTCWNWSTFHCYPCSTTVADLAAKCNQAYPDGCQGHCSPYDY